MQPPDIQRLLSLPHAMARDFAALERKEPPGWFAASDPPGSRLGSGGGTAHLLVEAWRATGTDDLSFGEWLGRSRKLMIHGGGHGRRLPSYAPLGKILMPLTVFRWSRGQRLDQALLDVQLPEYERVLSHAGPNTAVMITSGDVLLRFGRALPAFPDVDVLGLGMRVSPEKARNFGVFFSPRPRPTELSFFLQKPDPAVICQEGATHSYLVDTGMWLLSERAIEVLMRRCGWSGDGQAFSEGSAGHYELYGQFGLSLGSEPTTPDPEISALTAAVVPLPEAEFYHFGTSRQMIESVSALQNVELDEAKLGLVGAKRPPDQFVQNATFEVPLQLEKNHTLWVENSSVPKTWKLASEHVLTGVPPNNWNLRLEPRACLDFVPIGDIEWCIRFYGIDDLFQGTVGTHECTLLARSIGDWFQARDLQPGECGIRDTADLQYAPLFPVFEKEHIDPRFIEWLIAREPENNPDFSSTWKNARRLSASKLCVEVNLKRVYDQRGRNRALCLTPMLANARWSVFYRLDLDHTASAFATLEQPLPETRLNASDEPLHFIHDAMFRAAVLRRRNDPEWKSHESEAFKRLHQLIGEEIQLPPARPTLNVIDDQIVWARSPVRLDLAGGWTDTPPYCLEHGGRVVNLAVNLNGQPPIQVFAKKCPRPGLVIRSIDLGVAQTINTFEDLDTFSEAGSELAVAKAALALSGFLPRFCADPSFASLQAQLESLGGGIELSMLAAVPKGSGLGTSSILGATLLAALSDLCGLNWDRQALFKQTLALEQMLTTGGGWQDQAGAIFGGIKLIETQAGLAQNPNIRWLPPTLLGPIHANKTVLLYYTGLTRLAKGILQEIVRNICLNSPSHLSTLDGIGANSERCFNSIQCCDYDGLVDSIRDSWTLNQALDSGTNPPEVQAILDAAQPWLSACKLLGAGGGGFMLMFAKDAEAASRVRQELTTKPPNNRARFVDFELSERGLELTRS